MENDGGTLPNIIIFVVKSGGSPSLWMMIIPKFFG